MLLEDEMADMEQRIRERVEGEMRPILRREIEKEMGVHRQQERMRMYRDVYRALASHSTAGSDKALRWAERALMHFDMTFGG